MLPILSGLIVSGCKKAAPIDNIKINNVGYDIKDEKAGFITGVFADSFQVIDAKTERVVLDAEVTSDPVFDDLSGDYMQKVDFSELMNEGAYRLKINGLPKVSGVFEISEDPYSNGAIMVLRSFYLHRCGISITEGDWERPFCHLKPAYVYADESKERKVQGGWHDAGDYNKFTVTHNIAIAYLLMQYLDNPAKYIDGQLNLPESGNHIPDILDEIKWGLDWLIKMQDESGGLNHKVSIKEWTGENLPQDETDQQYIFRISSTGTAGAAAVFAMASSVYEKYDRAYSENLKNRAIRAWEYLEENEELSAAGGFINPEGVTGGEYGDKVDTDERLWASVELFKVTGEIQYLNYFNNNYGSSFSVLSWLNLINLAYYSYLNLSPKTDGVDPDIYNDLQNRMLSYGNSILKKMNESGYAYSLKENEFYWGSNSVAMGYSFDLIQIYKLTIEDKYREAALNQLHYALGRNPLGLSFVTGLGFRSVQDPYHQLSKLQGNGIPVPGMLVGGANYFSRLNGEMLSPYAAKSYEDSFRNYMVNEPAINYTASFSYTIGYFSDLGFAINQ
ncbi:glycoside hydrolase family 9 protein [Balneola sp. MJW-20]